MNTNRGSPWSKLARFSLALVVLIFFQNTYTQAQTQEAPKETPEVQQLKERLQKLEQTVQDLKGQINAIEETKKKTLTPAIVEATYSESATPATPATPEKSQDNNGKGESTFQVYGFAMLDMGYQVKCSSRSNITLRRTSVSEEIGETT